MIKKKVLEARVGYSYFIKHLCADRCQLHICVIVSVFPSTKKFPILKHKMPT